MRRFVVFLQTSLLGGVVVILPVAVLFIVFRWIFRQITGVISPVVSVAGLMFDLESRTQTVLAHLVVAAIIVAACFLVGVIVRTRLGAMAYRSVERHVLRVAPGYSIIKETVAQLLGSRRMLFSSIALVRIFGDETLATAFVMDTHPDGTHTVFVPTGPNPTSGFIYHVPADRVHPINVPVQRAMRSIISCGAGSSELISAMHARSETPAPPPETPA